VTGSAQRKRKTISMEYLIGETKRGLEVCIKEYQTATKRVELEKSAIGEHAWNHHHQIKWDDIEVLDEATHNSNCS